MASSPTEETMEMVPYIIKLSNILSDCTTSSLESSKLLYVTLFVQEAREKQMLPRILNEFEEKWKKSPLSLSKLFPHLIDYYADRNNPDWRSARSLIIGFYDRCNRKKSHSNTYPQNIKVPKSFRPLPSLYYTVQNDIQYFRQSYDERETAYKELQSQFQKFANQNPNLQCPVNKKYAILQRLAPPETVWQAKKDAFAEIFQRTRELFLFDQEEAHFHHAARLLDYWQSALERKNKPETRNDEGAFEKQAKEMKALQKVYIEVLERIQRNLKMDEVVRFVTNDMSLSKDFLSVRNVVSKHFEKAKYLLDGIDYVVPALVEQEASLASSLYKALHERQKLHDDVKRITAKLKNLLLQVQGWESLTGSQFGVEPPALGQPSDHPPENQRQVGQSEVVLPLDAQEQSNQPRPTASLVQTINNHGLDQPQTSNGQLRESNDAVAQHLEPQNVESQNAEPQLVQPEPGNQTSSQFPLPEQYDELLQPPPRELSEAELNEILQSYQEELGYPELDGHFFVSHPEVGEPQANEAQASEQAPIHRSSLLQESELLVQGQASQDELLASRTQEVGEDQGQQGQLLLQEVGDPAEQMPEENRSSQPQNRASPRDAPSSDQDIVAQVDQAENVEFQPLMDPFAADADGGLPFFSQELLEGFEAGLADLDAALQAE